MNHSENAKRLILDEQYQNYAQKYRLELMAANNGRLTGKVITPKRLAIEFMRWRVGIVQSTELDSSEKKADLFLEHVKEFSEWKDSGVMSGIV